jgi:endogenous inhibitor of DNA gyrase (YacG/DUF329 family)
MNDRNNPEVRCPTCQRRGAWFAGAWGPFCSKRCRLLDLGKWFNEEHQLSRELKPGDFEGLDQLESGPQLDRPDE